MSKRYSVSLDVVFDVEAESREQAIEIARSRCLSEEGGDNLVNQRADLDEGEYGYGGELG